MSNAWFATRSGVCYKTEVSIPLDTRQDTLTCLHSRCGAEDTEHSPPSGTQIVHPRLNHLLHAGQNHIASVWIVIMYHSIFERLQEILLKVEILQFLLLQETHGKLS